MPKTATTNKTNPLFGGGVFGSKARKSQRAFDRVKEAGESFTAASSKTAAEQMARVMGGDPVKRGGKWGVVTVKSNPKSVSAPRSIPPFGRIYGSEEYPSFISPEGPVWMWRKGQKVRFFTREGKQVGPEQANVAPTVAAAYAAGWLDVTMMYSGKTTKKSNPSSYDFTKLLQDRGWYNAPGLNYEVMKSMSDRFTRMYPDMTTQQFNKILDVTDAIHKLDGGNKRPAQFAEALQYAFVQEGKPDVLRGLKNATKDVEPDYRGGGKSVIAKRAEAILVALKGRRKNPSTDDKNIGSKESPLQDQAYGSMFYKKGGRWYRSLSFRSPGFDGKQGSKFGPWVKMSLYDSLGTDKGYKAGRLVPARETQSNPTHRSKNPTKMAASKAQYRLAWAVYEGRSTAMPKSVAEEIIRGTPKGFLGWGPERVAGDGVPDDFTEKGIPAALVGKRRNPAANPTDALKPGEVAVKFASHRSRDRYLRLDGFKPYAYLWSMKRDVGTGGIYVMPEVQYRKIKALRSVKGVSLVRDLTDLYRKEQEERNPALERVHGNPEPAAASMFESFHGYESGEIIEFPTTLHYHENLWACGVLIELCVELPSGKTAEISFTDPGDMPLESNPILWPWVGKDWIPYKTFPTEIPAQTLLGKLGDKGVYARVDRVRTRLLPTPKYKYEVLVHRDSIGGVVGGGVRKANGKKNPGPFTESGKLISKTAATASKPMNAFMGTVGEVGAYLDGLLGKAVGHKGSSSNSSPRKRKNPGTGTGELSDITYLTANETGNQIYFTGGDQSIDLSAFKITGPAANKDLITVGLLTHITYHTRKVFDGKSEEFDYIHKMGEKGGKPPTLLYDRMNQRLLVSGGTYVIHKPMLGTSPGIEH